MSQENTAQAFKTRDASSYDSVASDFAQFVDRFSVPLVRRLISLADLRQSERVLDIGTGTGIVALHAAPKVGESGKVLGIDLSEGMLATAKAKAKALQAGLTGIAFQQMDAEKLELKNASFDAVLSLFALRHFPRPSVALKEMSRVLRPGGRLVVAIGSGPPLRSFDGLKAGLQRLIDVIHTRQGKRLIACDFLNSLVQKCLPESAEPEEAVWTREHPHLTDSVPKLVRAAGFTQVRCEWTGQRWVISTPEEFWDLQAIFSSLARKRLAGASTQKAAALKQDFIASCRNVQSRGGKLVYPTGALFVCGHRA